MAKKEFPKIKKKNEGKFTAWVEKNMDGMDTCKAASKVIKSRTKKYSPAVVKMAEYANNFGCKTKKNDGASVPLKGKQKNLPEGLQKKILASDGASMKEKRANKKIAKGQLHKKMSVAQKQEAMKNKTARFTQKLGVREEEGAPMKKKTNKKLTDQKGYIKQSNSGRGTNYDQKKEGETLKGGRKYKYYKDGKKVAVAKDRVAGFGKNKRRTGSTIDIKK